MLGPMTKAQFSAQCAFIAKDAAAWAGDLLSLPETYDKIVDQSVVARFTDRVREHLDMLDGWSGRTPSPVA